MGTSKLTKIREWVSLTAQNPVEAMDRVLTVVDVKSDKMFVTPPDYKPVTYDSVWDTLLALGNFDGDEIAAEAAALEDEIRKASDALRDAPINPIHSADFALARICYLATRVAQPGVVLETGVAYGVTSAFILSALEKNGDGVLHSIDLPPLGRNVDQFVGALIPDAVRHRWRLYRGVTKRVLPKLLSQVGTVDMFVHDSLHTYRNIKFELQRVTPQLKPGAIVIADDIDENPAFEEWEAETSLAFSGVVQEERKDSMLGIAIMPQ